ncbi:unnamed protein product, partial [Choristocarpus tenellus]
ANSTSNTTSSELKFIYTVQRGDNASQLTADTGALVSNTYSGGGSMFIDLLGRDVNTTLPIPGSSNSLSGKSSFTVDTDAPYVIGLGSSLLGGEYGVGQ